MTRRTAPALRRLSAALFAALALPAVPALAQQSGAADASTQQEARTLDRVTVTGSRIKRAQMEEALPITAISKEQIDAAGITSAEQLLLNLNIAGNGADNLSSNVGLGGGDEQRGNRGLSGANLRGQGADATLVLLNGRRVATHGLAGKTVDLNSIPFAAIERVEVLRDGASAIYGTDAIGGVINFITKRDFQGAQVATFLDVTEDGGGNIYRGSLLFGHGDVQERGWNVFGSLSVKRTTILRGHDRDFSNGNQPTRGLVADTRGTPFATPTNVAGSMMGRTITIPGTTRTTTGVIDPLDNTVQQVVSPLDLPGGPGCAAGGPNMFPYDHQLWGLPSSRYACAWDYPAAGVITQPQDSVDFVGRGTFRIGANHELYAELTASRITALNEFEPQQLSSSASTAATSLGPSSWFPLTAASKPSYDRVYNALAGYFGAGALDYGRPITYRWRCMDCGPRQIETTTDANRLLVGMSGLLGEWSYDVGLWRASSSAHSVLGTGYYYTNALKQAMGSGFLSPFLMPGEQQSAEGMALLQAASAQGVRLFNGQSTVTALDASVTGDLPFFGLPGGAIAMATGVDLRREQYQLRDHGGAQGHIFQAPFDSNYAMNRMGRDIKAFYAEFHLPILSTLDLNIAGRYDHYSGFGSTVNPKYSFSYRPADWLMFRGAYSTGFKAPTFTQLYRGISEQQYVGLDLADPARCPGGKADARIPGCEVIRPDEWFGGKPDLMPETSVQRSLGMVFSPMEWFNLALDWWEIQRENTIRPADRTLLIQNYDLFKDNWIRDSAGNVIAIDRRFVNSGGSRMRGIEVDANFMHDLAGGRFTINLNGSLITEYRTKFLSTTPYSDNRVDQYVRYVSLPLRWKHTLSFSWSRGAWTHNLTQLHRDGYADELPLSVESCVLQRPGCYLPTDWKPRVDSYNTWSYNVTWTGIQDLKLGFGIRNLFNTDPPFTAKMNDFGAGAGWEPRIADPRGRAYTFLAEYRFW